MTSQHDTIREQSMRRAREALQKARALRHSRRTLGEDGIYQHVEDVDGNWLENWSDESNPALGIAGNISPNGQNLPTQTD